MELLILKQENSTYRDVLEKLNEETFEVEIETMNGTKKDLVTEYLDVIQVCIWGLTKLKEDGFNLKEEIEKHNKKLLNRGWEYKAVINLEIVGGE